MMLNLPRLSRNVSKPPGSMAQLTIFYAGSVCVYNDISPEKVSVLLRTLVCFCLFATW